VPYIPIAKARGYKALLVIFSLENLPRRGALSKIGAFADKGYRQLFIKNFTVIYRVDVVNKQVVIVTVRYSKSQF